jgi:5S rRNA maturation endonuclease (ribonuclease M5)
MIETKLTCEQVARVALGQPARRGGRELFYRCPHPELHENGDVHPSLQINPEKNVFMCGPCGASGNAWALAAFLTGCDPGDKSEVKAWLKERGLNGAKPKAKSGKRGPCVATYLYRDAVGNPVARKLRFEPGVQKDKDFVWERWEGGEWKSGLGENGGKVKLPLYRQAEIKDSDWAVVTEGEKDADAGARIQLPTCTSGGTGTFNDDHAEALRGKHVVIIADADEAGCQHAQKVAASLFSKAASVKVVEIPGSKDLAEAIAKGMPREVLLALFEETPEWRPATGAEILNSMMGFIRPFVSMSEAQAQVVVLWIAHTHAVDAADCTPYLNPNSAEKQSGKTRLLEVCEPLVSNPWLTGRVTAATLTRKIDDKHPTLLLDESDAAFKGEQTYAEALRGVLNTGYRRGGVASCCVGQGANISYKDFSTFCPKAIAGIGQLPDTVADRSIPIRLKRAPRGTVERFRERDAEREAAPIKAKLAAWCAGNLEKLKHARPEIPSQLSDRQADVCEPLLAIADLAAGNWPQDARRALVELCVRAQAQDDSIGVQLLRDIKAIFGEKKIDELTSSDLAEALAKIETSPWGEWSKGKPLSTAKLARLLKPFSVYPAQIKNGAARGYKFTDFEEAFSLYLPPESVKASETRENSGDDGNSKVSNETPSDTSENELLPNKHEGNRHFDTLKPGIEESDSESGILFEDEFDASGVS